MGLHIAADRRVSGERRRGERRRAVLAMPLERRRGVERRRALDRREAPAGHIRHAMQLLGVVWGHGTLAADDRKDVEAALRRLWFALGDIERGRRAGPR